ncbi:6-bladed beta-propeller [Carboxylicivirga sp. N1Y90]|uniref:6-bladed beta-propeller n=1 Tax=Carboxylicivirga fragile TaxID=3417571 RepID=UPI003D345C3D|nr:6-bladed beta-propeller [Marinilabiliaceae bacterium N1Y90]
MRNLAIIYILLIFTNCKMHKNEQVIIDVYSNEIKSKLSTEIAREFEYISLETNNNSIIGQVDKVHVNDSNLFILDRRNAKALFVFDLSGNYKHKLNSHGKGPGEFLNPQDFSIDKDSGDIFLLDFGNKILKYNSKGEFEREIRLGKSMRQVTNILIYENKIFAYANRLSEEYKYTLCSYSMEGTLLESFYPYEEVSEGIFNMASPLYVKNDSLHFFNIYDREIQVLTENGFKTKQIFDFGVNFLPSGMLGYLAGNIDGATDYAIFGKECVEGANYSYLTIIDKNVFKHCIYSKKDNRSYLINKIVNDSDFFRYPEYYHEGYFYSVIEPQWVINNKEKYNGMIEKLHLAIDDNPILLKHKLDLR